MATAAQITGEIWWQREVITTELDWCADELCRRTGQPRTAAGTKGNTAHLNGGHRSQEWIKNSVYCTNRTYTAQAGLSADQARHVAGLDFTPGVWGTARNRQLMCEQTSRLLAAMKAGQLDEVLELYGTIDGRTVTGWNNPGDRFASSDSSHLDHWHLTIDRRHLTNMPLMRRIVAIALGDQPPTTANEEDDMIGFAKDPATGQLRKSSGGITFPTTQREIDDIRSLAKQGVIGPVSSKVHDNLAYVYAFGYPVELLINDIAKRVIELLPASGTGVTEAQVRDMIAHTGLTPPAAS